MEMLWFWGTGLRNEAWWWRCYFRKSIQHHFQVHRYSRWKRPIRSFVCRSCQERIMAAIDIWIFLSLSRCPLCSSTNVGCRLLLPCSFWGTALSAVLRLPVEAVMQLSKGQGKSVGNNFHFSHWDFYIPGREWEMRAVQGVTASCFIIFLVPARQIRFFLMLGCVRLSSWFCYPRLISWTFNSVPAIWGGSNYLAFTCLNIFASRVLAVPVGWFLNSVLKLLSGST